MMWIEMHVSYEYITIICYARVLHMLFSPIMHSVYIYFDTTSISPYILDLLQQYLSEISNFHV